MDWGFILLERANYGIDSFRTVLFFIILAGLGAIISISAFFTVGWGVILGKVFIIAGFIQMLTFSIISTWMIYSSLYGKMIVAERVIDYDIKLQGSEHVLDCGCGNGLYMIEIAKRLTTGICTGVDLLDKNTIHLMKNIQREGVFERSNFVESNLESLPFEDESFDIVISSFTLHRFPKLVDQAKLMNEMIRVCRPGGKIVLLDLASTSYYVPWLQEWNIDQVERMGPSFRMFPPVYVVKGMKALSENGEGLEGQIDENDGYQPVDKIEVGIVDS